ncbi:unnamed protein product, partial [marine sediment metagenome]
EWFDGEWYNANFPTAKEADSVGVYIDVENQGESTDTLFGEFVSAQVTPGEFLIQEMPSIGVGAVGDVEWTFIMPPNAVDIIINAGHVE